MRSARLAFGIWSVDDVELVRALWGDARVTRFVGGPFTEEFTVRDVRALVARHHPQNVDSRRVIEQLGRRYVRDEYYAPDRAHASVVFDHTRNVGRSC